MARAYIPHNQMRRDRDDPTVFKPARDTAKAARFGERVIVFEDLEHRKPLIELLDKAEKAMSEFNREDFLVFAGDPRLILVCAAIAQRRTRGKYNLLVWNNRILDYEARQIADSVRTLQGVIAGMQADIY